MPSWIATTSNSSSAVIGAIRTSSAPLSATLRIWSVVRRLPVTSTTLQPMPAALIARATSYPDVPSSSASSTASAGFSFANSAVASSPLAATTSSASRRRKVGVAKCRRSSLLFETRTFGTCPIVSEAGAEQDDQGDQEHDRAADRGQPADQRRLVVGVALGGELVDLGCAGADRGAQAIDPQVQLGELGLVDAVEVDQRAERHQPAHDLGLGLRGLFGLALGLGFELGEPVAMPLARVVEAAPRRLELGLCRVVLGGLVVGLL